MSGIGDDDGGDDHGDDDLAMVHRGGGRHKQTHQGYIGSC